MELNEDGFACSRDRENFFDFCRKNGITHFKPAVEITDKKKLHNGFDPSYNTKAYNVVTYEVDQATGKVCKNISTNNWWKSQWFNSNHQEVSKLPMSAKPIPKVWTITSHVHVNYRQWHNVSADTEEDAEDLFNRGWAIFNSNKEKGVIFGPEIQSVEDD